MPLKRFAQCATATPDSVIACGGYWFESVALSSCYQLTNGEWHRIQDYPVVAGHSLMLTLNNLPYVFGGLTTGNAPIANVHVLNFADNWEAQAALPVALGAIG